MPGNKVVLQTYETEDLAELDLEFLNSLGIEAELEGVKIHVYESDLEDAKEAIGFDEDGEEHSFDDEDEDVADEDDE